MHYLVMKVVSNAGGNGVTRVVLGIGARGGSLAGAGVGFAPSAGAGAVILQPAAHSGHRYCTTHLYFGRSHSYSFFTKVFFTRLFPQRGVTIGGLGHFSPHLQALSHCRLFSHCFPSQSPHSRQRHPGSSGQNSSHLTSQQYFFTFSVPQISWQVRFWQLLSQPHWAQRFAEPQPAGSQQATPLASAANAWDASKEIASVREMPIILMFKFSLNRPA
jgi:hypothetical protein